MDNNTAERAIRPFTLGRKNWVNVDSIRGAEASVIMCSLVETAKANGLRVYEYLEYVLTELVAHQDDTSRDSPIFKFSAAVRKVIYTTNSIESLNATYRKLNRQRSVFPSDTALLKALYLSTFEATKKWTTTIRNWAQVYGELSNMYKGRLPE